MTAIALLAWCLPVAAVEPPDAAAAEQARIANLKRASDAVLGVRVLAIEDAASNDTLGPARQGSGVVIGSDGLVLTIGYLILEADQVQLLLDDGRVLPARVVAYDPATGFGLVQSLAPLRVEPVPFGDTSRLKGDDPLMVVSGGEQGSVSLARVVAQRPFAAYWEYELDTALFTAPARTDHPGAALFNAQGELLGIGALLVRDALGEDGLFMMPGNLFVPIDLLKPILDELRSHGSSLRSRRAWIGVSCIEQGGALRVVRVSVDSPAELAGLRPGDRIVSIDGTEVMELSALWHQLWTGGQPERDITLDIRRNGEARQLKMHTVDRMTTLKHAEGI
jgi:S1-C subfamily serine protease